MSRYRDLVILLLPKASFICKFPLFITPATYPPGVGCLSSVSPCPLSAEASFRYYLGTPGRVANQQRPQQGGCRLDWSKR